MVTYVKKKLKYSRQLTTLFDSRGPVTRGFPPVRGNRRTASAGDLELKGLAFSILQDVAAKFCIF